MANNNSTLLVENYWAIYWELGFFYVPNALLFLVSVVLYIRIIFKIRKNSKQLEQRKRIQQQLNEEKKLKQSPLAPATSSSGINLFNNINNTPKTPSNSTNNLDWGGVLTPPSNNKPVISSATPMEYFDIPTPADVFNSNSNVQLLLEPFHFRLSRITLTDIEEYAKFLQTQTRTASYYIGVFMLNWIVSIIARIIWEFGRCQYEKKTSRIMFVILLIVMECSGPRIECFLLSIIYGIAENTIQPHALRDVFTDLVTLRYFKEFCSRFKRVNPSSVTSSSTLSPDLDGEIHVEVTDPWCCFYPLRNTDDDQANEENEISPSNSSRNNEVRGKYDDLIFFWFDVQKIKDVMSKRAEAISEYTKLTKSNNPDDENKITEIKSQIEFYKKKIHVYAREICSLYLSESAPFNIHKWNVFSNLQRNRIRTLVLQMSDDDSSESGSDHDDSDESSSPDTDSVSSNNTLASNNSSAVNSSTVQATVTDDKFIIVEEEDANDEFGGSFKDDKLIRLLSEPQKKAFQRLSALMSSFRESTLFQELTHVLRMKAVSKSRSLYRDIIKRMFLITYSSMRKAWWWTKKCYSYVARGYSSGAVGDAYVRDYDDEGNDDYDSFDENDHHDDENSGNIQISDIEIYIYIKEQKRLKLKERSSNSQGFFQ